MAPRATSGRSSRREPVSRPPAWPRASERRSEKFERAERQDQHDDAGIDEEHVTVGRGEERVHRRDLPARAVEPRDDNQADAERSELREGPPAGARQGGGVRPRELPRGPEREPERGDPTSQVAAARTWTASPTTAVAVARSSAAAWLVIACAAPATTSSTPATLIRPRAAGRPRPLLLRRERSTPATPSSASSRTSHIPPQRLWSTTSATFPGHETPSPSFADRSCECHARRATPAPTARTAHVMPARSSRLSAISNAARDSLVERRARGKTSAATARQPTTPARSEKSSHRRTASTRENDGRPPSEPEEATTGPAPTPNARLPPVTWPSSSERTCQMTP